MTNPMMFLLLIGLVLGQSSFTIKPKYPHLKLIEEWTFESMETITYPEEEESEVVFKDQGNTESLSFHRSGSLSFMALTNGIMKKGRGTWLVKDDIATTAEIDDAIRFGFGLRWAQMGLFETYRLAGCEEGMAHFIAQFGPCLSSPWTKLMDVPDLTYALVDKIAS